MGYAALLTPPATIGVQATGLNLQQLNPALPPIADIYVGQLAITYYLDPAAPLTGTWEAAPGGPGVPSTNLTRFNPVPVPKAENFPIPVFVTVPNVASGQAKPVDGWPVVIFQHGLQGNRTQSAAVAGAYASQGFVVVAIDIPLHGITDPANPLYQAGAERTFDLDLVDNCDRAPPVRTASSTRRARTSSTSSSLLTSRDNLRQAALDIVQLVGALPTLDLDGDTVRGPRSRPHPLLVALARRHRRDGGERDADPHGLGLPQRAGRRPRQPAARLAGARPDHQRGPRGARRAGRARRSTSSSSAMRRRRSTPATRSTTSTTPSRRARCC